VMLKNGYCQQFLPLRLPRVDTQIRVTLVRLVHAGRLRAVRTSPHHYLEPNHLFRALYAEHVPLNGQMVATRTAPSRPDN
jgi:hypothetical protein